MKHRRSGGFTLVELLIVIMIIGILAGLVLLAMGEARDTATATRIVSDLRTLKAAATMYYVDTGSWLEPGGSSIGVFYRFEDQSEKVAALERYMNSSIHKDRYYGVVLRHLYHPSLGQSGSNRSGNRLIGLMMASQQQISRGVVEKLAKNASTTGIVDGEGDPFTVVDVVPGRSIEVYMPLQ